MGLRRHSFAIDEYYHLYNRGVDKRVVFKDKKDYQHFMHLMYICNTKKSIVLRDIGEHFERGNTIVNIGAYSLMPNHFHLLVREKVEGGISLYMQKLTTAYVMYFNQKYDRTGGLFQGTFKSSICDTDLYIKYMYAYIHLNPAKLIDKEWKNRKFREVQKLFKYVFSYEYSSISEYARSAFHITFPQAFPKYFKNPEAHKRELLDWLTP